MENTMNKSEYIKENIIWNLLIFIWCKSLFFRCLPGISYFESVLVLLGIAVLVIGFGIALTWNWGRNYRSVVENIIMTWCLYVVIAYADVFRKRMMIIAIVTTMITLLMTLMIVARRIRRKDKKKQIIRRRVRNTVALWRRNTAVASLVLLVPIGATVMFNGTVLTSSEVEVIEMYGDEHSLSANIEVISNIEPSRWSKLNMQEKLDVLQKIINCECRYNGISHEVYLGTAELSGSTLAHYDDSKYQIVIDINHLDDDGYEVLETIIHECTHAYQHEQVELYRSLDEKSRNLLMFWEVSEYMDEFENYIDGSEDPYGYYLQLAEIDARERAEKDSLEYIERINEYLKEQNEQSE